MRQTGEVITLGTRRALCVRVSIAWPAQQRRLRVLALTGVLACAHSPPIELQPEQSQLGCFKMHLDLSAAQARMLYISRAPTFVEFRPERSAWLLRRGLVVRSSPYPGTEDGPSAVWHPIEHGGIALDWGTGFAGFTASFARSGSRYVGRAETYVDVEGVPVESFSASLERATCDQEAAQPAVMVVGASPRR